MASTVWLAIACIIVVAAVTNMIWKSEVPTTTVVAMPSR